jgi:uncharacterized protein (TIGR04222 family)
MRPGSAILARVIVVMGAAAALSLATRPAHAQFVEQVDHYDAVIEIRTDDSIRITETIDYDFGVTEHHGIIRAIPTRLAYDETSDRLYPLHLESVTATEGASADAEIEQTDGGLTVIRIGDPDRTVSGDVRYTLVYTVDAALNGFDDHDELYWNPLGLDTQVPVERATIKVEAPATITQVACFHGPLRSTLPCDRAVSKGTRAVFGQAGLGPFEGVTVVVGLPKGAVAAPAPILAERWAFDRAFSLTPVTGGTAGLLTLAAVGGIGVLAWRTGRDRRFRGSPIDQVMGNADGQDESVPPFDADAEAPVEFAPPDGMLPGQMGTLVDERANTLDVSATIVDLAVRGHLMIQEIPKEGWLGKPDWTLIRLEEPEEGLQTYERRLLDGLFRDGSEVTISALKNTFASRLEGVEESMYVDAVNRGWFRARPDKVRTMWRGRGLVLVLAGAAVTFVLARWTHLGLLGIPVFIAGLAMLATAGHMPARTAQGTAMLRRVRGFRRVIETAETHMARWAEKEKVFTALLPYAVVFGCTDRWAKAFQDIGVQPDTSWYVSPRPFVFAGFADAMDGFTITTGGTIASNPSGSGASGLGGGGFSGGGGGGGGVGSW